MTHDVLDFAEKWFTYLKLIKILIINNLHEEILLNILWKTKKVILGRDPNIKNLEESISNKTGLSVLIKSNRRNKGSITISFHDNDQLNRLIEIIKNNY